MKPWPTRTVPNIAQHGALEAVCIVLNEERARADAAMERLRVAVEALESIARETYFDVDGIVRPVKDPSGFALACIGAIGEVP